MDKNRYHILLIEDDPDDVLLLEGMITDSGEACHDFTMETADRLSAGLERIAQGGIDIVLLDLGLPDSLGMDTLRNILAKSPELPIVVLTGLTNEHCGIEALQEGAQDYQVKDQVNGPLLLRSLRYAKERKRMALEKEELISELKNALASVKLLSGMLPICASCKNIRDDEGYWHQIEWYVREHSEADFSHAICPECIKRLYPDYQKKLDSNKE